MENAVEALKIAFAVLLFVLALSLSMSSFSQATEAVGEIMSLRDKHMQYKSVVPSKDFTRTVGLETIIPTLYTAYDKNENVEIHFQRKKVDGSIESMPIYYKINQYGEREIDKTTMQPIKIYTIDFDTENLKEIKNPSKHLDMILAVGNNNKSDFYDETMVEKYKNEFYEDYPYGFYEYLKGELENGYVFKEELGEFMQGEKEGTAIKKRVITYTLVKENL